MNIFSLLPRHLGQNLWGWAALGLAGALAFSCSGDDGARPTQDAERGPWGIGGQGGAPPLYGEGGEAFDELKLRFKKLPLAASGGGTDMAFLPHKKEMLITLREGHLYHVKLQGEEMLPIRKWAFDEEIITDFACGPTNILLDYYFEENGFIYVSYCVDDQVTRLVRYNFTAATGPTNPAVIFETHVEEPAEDGLWHRIGSLGWEDSNTLWMLVGDHFLRDEAQNVANPFGGVHRIVPNRKLDGEGHEAASGNMLELGLTGRDGSTPVPTLYAYGFRSPWRGTRDASGRLYIGDVGLGAYEEVNLLTDVGQNFGWDDAEGPCTSSCDGFVDPIAYYTREDDDPYVDDDPETMDSDLRAIWVGEIYESPTVDRYQGLMDGVVAFGDLFTGWVRGLRVDDEGNVVSDELLGHLPSVTQWRVGPDGYVYVLDLNGQIYVALLDSE